MAAAGAPLGAKDDAGYTPLHWAAEFGRALAASALVDAGAPLELLDRVGLTPRDVAAEHNKGDVLRVLDRAAASRSGPT